MKTLSYGGYSGTVAAQKPASRSVAIRNRFMKRVFVFFGITAFLGLFYVWSRVQVLEMRHQINELESRLVRLDESWKIEKIQLSTLISTSRLEDVAKNQLHMAPPTSDQMVIVTGKKNKPKPTVAANGE